jgi:hypothetical protein
MPSVQQKHTQPTALRWVDYFTYSYMVPRCPSIRGLVGVANVKYLFTLRQRFADTLIIFLTGPGSNR